MVVLLFKVNKEDTKAISKYFPKLIIKTSFIRPNGTLLRTIVPLNLSYVHIQFQIRKFSRLLIKGVE